MRKLITFILCLFAFNVYATSPKKILNIQHWKTQKGTSVYFVKIDNLPMLDVRVIFAAGSAYDGKLLGVSTLANSLIGEGTKKQSADEIAQVFDSIGAKFSTDSGRDKAVISLRTLTKPAYLNAALSEFTQVIGQPSFSAKALQRVKNQMTAAIKVNEQNPGSVASKAFYDVVYQDQPYSHDPLGSVASIKKMVGTDARRFYSHYYVEKNADIVLVGDLTLENAKQVAELIANALPQGRRPSRLKMAVPSKVDINLHIKFPAKQTAIMMGQVGINRHDPNYFPLVVGNYAFGGLPLGSVLFKEVRDQKGLAYYAGSSFSALQYRGPFVIQLKTRSTKTKEALDTVRKALDSFLNNGPTEQQLNAAKQNLIGSFPLALSSNANIASIVSNIAFYHLPLDYLDTYINKVRAVTPQQVKQAFAKTIQPERLAIITVGPAVSNSKK